MFFKTIRQLYIHLRYYWLHQLEIERKKILSSFLEKCFVLICEWTIERLLRTIRRLWGHYKVLQRRSLLSVKVENANAARFLNCLHTGVLLPNIEKRETRSLQSVCSLYDVGLWCFMTCKSEMPGSLVKREYREKLWHRWELRCTISVRKPASRRFRLKSRNRKQLANNKSSHRLLAHNSFLDQQK